MAKIDTLVMIIGDQNSGKSNQIRSLFTEFEMVHHYNGYPTSNNISRYYDVHPDIDLYVRLSSWHEAGKSYRDVKSDLQRGSRDPRKRYKAIVPAQITPTPKLVAGEELFIKLFADFDIRRGYAVWLDPDRLGRKAFSLSVHMASFLSANRHASALAIDSVALHPSAAPVANSVNARLLADILFRT